MSFINYCLSIIVLTRIIMFTNIFSCNGKNNFFTATDKANQNMSLLWEISGNGLHQPSYIFGTMHLLCAKDATLSNNLKSIIKQADEIYFEVDIDDLGELLTGILSGSMKNDTTLQELYTAAEYERISNFFEVHRLPIPLNAMSKMEPMLVSALVYQSLLPCMEADGMEMSIMQEAHQYTKEIKGLETAAFQLDLINQIPYGVQAKELLRSIDSANTFKHQLDEMMQLYKTQDIEKLLKFTLEGEYGDEQVQDILLNKRNKKWVNLFPEITKGKSLLIAVGAGHLGGAEGILNLLKKNGYTVKAMQN